MIGDGHLGIWGALRNVYPQAEEQRCWNHRIVNLLAKLPKRVHKPLRQSLTPRLEKKHNDVQHWCRQRGLTLAAELIEQDWDRMVTFYNYQRSSGSICEPPIQWSHRLPLFGANGRGQAIQESGKRPGGLEDAVGGGAAIPPVPQGAKYVNGVPVPEEKAA